MHQTMQALQSELDSLRADNIKLYEKIKFLQSYPGRVCLCVCEIACMKALSSVFLDILLIWREKESQFDCFSG